MYLYDRQFSEINYEWTKVWTSETRHFVFSVEIHDDFHGYRFNQRWFFRFGLHFEEHWYASMAVLDQHDCINLRIAQCVNYLCCIRIIIATLLVRGVSLTLCHFEYLVLVTHYPAKSEYQFKLDLKG